MHQPTITQVVIPDVAALKHDLMQEFHDAPTAGHPGMERTLDLISRFYWWPGMLMDVHAFVRSCPACQLNKSTQRRRVPLETLPIPVRKWESVSIDFITHLPWKVHATKNLPPCSSINHSMRVGVFPC